jgi:ATP-dependent DNA ligase
VPAGGRGGGAAARVDVTDFNLASEMTPNVTFVLNWRFVELSMRHSKTHSIEGATSAKMPGFIKPQLATLRSKAPKGSQWLHEIKYDGYRVQIHLNKGKKKVLHPQRAGLDQVIAGALDLPGQAIIDGEVVVIKDGRTNFSELQAELAAGRQDKLVFSATGRRYLNMLPS